MGPLRPYLTKIFLAWDWWRASSANLRKSVGKRRQGFGKGGQGKEEKRGRGGWGMARKKEGGVGRWVGDDVIKNNKK